MSNKYRYDHKPTRHRKRHVIVVTLASVFVAAVLTIILVYLINQTTNKVNSVSGPTELVGAAADNSTVQTYQVNEPDYVFSLPVGWKMVKVNHDSTDNNITWQPFAPDPTGRILTIYQDIIPTNYAINRLLPVQAHGSSLSYGSLSDNCSNFTPATAQSALVPVTARWQNVTFLCNTPNFADNQIGTGSPGSPINTVTLTGAGNDTHKFFFLYIDRNSNPDYTILYSILDSFQLK